MPASARLKWLHTPSRNNGPGAVTNQMEVSDVIPAGFGYVSAVSSNPTNYYSFGLGRWVFPFGLASGVTETLAITVSANTAGLYTNTATILVPPGVTDPNTNNNMSSAVVTVTNAPTYKITGFVLFCATNGPGLSNVTIQLTGNGISNTTVSGAGGMYMFTNVPAGNGYVLTPSRTNYTFLPASLTLNVTSNTTAGNFVGYTFVIQGQVREGTNLMPVKPMPAVAVKLAGAQTRTNFTDAGGFYVFTNLPAGAYSLTPMTNGYCFDPTNVTLYLTNLAAVTNNCTNVVNFVGTSNTPPGIAVQPQSVTNCVGGSLTLSVTVTGCPPFSFQWRFDTNVIVGATNATFTITNLTGSNFGGYFVVITNAFGAVTSAPACVTVCVPGLGSRTKVVNVMPNRFSNENAQNSEPSIGVSPMNPTNILIACFDQVRPAVDAPFVFITMNNPFFLSDAGGGGPLSWSLYADYNHGDVGVEWSAGGTAYAALLNNTGVRRLSVSSSPALCAA